MLVFKLEKDFILMMHHKSKNRKNFKENDFNKFFFLLLFRCEFASRNLNGCQSSQYFTPIEPVPAVPGPQLVTG
jgi:hypothetical protein